jgi:hypothetical protein
MLQLCYGYVTVMLRLCSVMLRLCYSYLTVMLRLCYSYVTVMLRLCYGYVTVMLQLCYGYVTVMLRLCYGLLQLCYSCVQDMIFITYFQNQILTCYGIAVVFDLPPGFNIKKFYMVLKLNLCVLWSSQEKRRILLYTITDCLCITEVHSIYFAVRAESTY